MKGTRATGRPRLEEQSALQDYLSQMEAQVAQHPNSIDSRFLLLVRAAARRFPSLAEWGRAIVRQRYKDVVEGKIQRKRLKSEIQSMRTRLKSCKTVEADTLSVLTGSLVDNADGFAERLVIDDLTNSASLRDEHRLTEDDFVILERRLDILLMNRVGVFEVLRRFNAAGTEELVRIAKARGLETFDEVSVDHVYHPKPVRFEDRKRALRAFGLAEIGLDDRQPESAFSDEMAALGDESYKTMLERCERNFEQRYSQRLEYSRRAQEVVALLEGLNGGILLSVDHERELLEQLDAPYIAE